MASHTAKSLPSDVATLYASETLQFLISEFSQSIYVLKVPDPVIPADEGRALFAAANQPKKLVTFPGAGHNVFGSVGDRYINLIEDFIREALKAAK
jgi:fermentation-respiration switch protein FrsA (DUF1100 family)